MFDSACFLIARHTAYLLEEEKPHAVPGSWFRHSDAAKCSRYHYYKIKGFPKKKADAASLWVMNLGTLVHDAWQDWFLAQDPGHTIEAVAYIDECDSSGHADGLAGDTVYELKTVNGTGFRQLTKDKTPRLSALLQGALNAYALGAEELIVTYLSMEGMSEWKANELGVFVDVHRVSQTFRYQKHEFMPLATAEIARLADINRMIRNEEVPARVVMDDSYAPDVVVDPLTGKLAGGKKTWQCGYCPFQAQCASDAITEAS